MLAILRNRNYFWLWFGQTISQVGDGIRDWAMIYWVFRASGESPLMMALSLIATQAPLLLLAPVAGVWVDRWDRRRTMIISDLLRGLLSLLLIAAVLSGQYLYALGVSFLASCVAQFFGPARAAMVRRVVGPEHLLQANSLGQTTWSAIQLAAPALGTAVFLVLGARFSFTLDAVSFFLSAACIALVTASGAVTERREHVAFLPELKEGLRFCWDSRPLRVIIIAGTILMMGGGAVNTLGILIVKRSLGLPETAFGFVTTLQPLLSLLTAVTIGSAAQRLRRVALLVPAGMAACGLAIAMMAGALSLYWFLTASALMGIGNVVMNMGAGTTQQAVVPDRLMGRVSGVFMTPIVTAMMLSAGLAGTVALYVSPRAILAFAATMILLAALYAFAGLRSVVLPGAEPGPEQAQAGD